MDFETYFTTVTEPIEGWFSKEEAKYLWDLCEELPEHSKIVEIGSYKGRSSSILLYWTKERAHSLTLIDAFCYPHNSADLLSARLDGMGYQGHYDLIYSASLEAAARLEDKTVDLILIDGDHTYGGVERDFNSYNPKVKPYGVIAFHDYYNADHWDVKEAIHALTPKWEILGRARWLLAKRKPYE